MADRTKPMKEGFKEGLEGKGSKKPLSDRFKKYADKLKKDKKKKPSSLRESITNWWNNGKDS